MSPRPSPLPMLAVALALVAAFLFGMRQGVSDPLPPTRTVAVVPEVVYVERTVLTTAIPSPYPTRAPTATMIPYSSPTPALHRWARGDRQTQARTELGT